MDADELSVLTQTTQGVSRDSLSAFKEITQSQSEEETCLLTQKDVAKQGKTKLDVKANTKKQPISQETRSRKNVKIRRRLILRRK
eukprot:8256177-Ditylum_brightwellii.AAC.1